MRANGNPGPYQELNRADIDLALASVALAIGVAGAARHGSAAPPDHHHAGRRRRVPGLGRS